LNPNSASTIPNTSESGRIDLGRPTPPKRLVP